MSEEVEQPTLEHMRKLAEEYISDYLKTDNFLQMAANYYLQGGRVRHAMTDAYCAGYRLGVMNAKKAREKNCESR